MKGRGFVSGNISSGRSRNFRGMGMRISGLFVALLVFSFSGAAYAQWVSVDPPSLSDDWELLGVHFPSIHEGWAVGWDAANDMQGRCPQQRD